MLNLAVRFVVSLTGLMFLNFVVSDEGGNGAQDRLKPKSEQMYFPTDLPHHHDRYGVPCRTCNYHNREGYPPPSHHSNEMYPSSPTFQHTYEYHRDHQFPAGFKHTPEFHQTNSGGRDGRNFHGTDEKVGSGTATVLKNNSIQEIPLEFFERFDNTDVNDLLSNFVEGYEQETTKPSLFFGNRFGDEGQERNAGMIPAKAACTPENVSVSLLTSDDPSVVYIPKCTRIERCGGCCSHKLLACQPTEKETMSVQVIKTQYVGAKKLKYVGKEVIPLERHLHCKCSCKIKAEHCLPNQQYKASECACVCGNVDEQRKCSRDPDRKFWDHKTCTCKCRYVIECSTGSSYDHNECRCKNVPKRRYANFERKIVVEDVYMTPLNLYDLK